MSHRLRMPGVAVTACVWVLLGGGAGAQRGMPEPLALDDRTGFVAIFDGETLTDWDGDETFWRVEDGAIIGESTVEHPLETNTFLIWRGGEPADFELMIEYRMTAGNSGIQYRSADLPEEGPWVMRGYQADFDHDNQWTGQLYEELGRGFLAMRGQATSIPAGGPARVIGHLQDADQLKALVDPTEWNHVHVIARGQVLTHIVNGHVMSVAVDDDAEQRAMRGLIGFQLHSGPPMKVEIRNVFLKE